MPLPMQNVDEVKRNEACMAMHAAQKVAAQSGHQAVAGAHPNRRQNIATGIGVAAVVAVLVVLSALRVI